jgi:hypothetical protein
VRRHTKASTAGSTQRQAKGLGRILRGVFATCGSLLDSKGSSAPKSRRLALPLALLVVVFSLVLGVGSASALTPTISSTSVSAVTTKAALLEAEINPEGEATTYHFEYGTADCASNPCTSTPVPNGNVGSASAAVRVSKEIAGLSPGTTYHFRVIAVNGSGPSESLDRTFTTYALPAQEANCPNQAFRVGPAANLPDCRAYEMVSPVDKNGGDIRTLCNFPCDRTGLSQSSLDGNRITYSSNTAFGDAASGPYTNQYLATRGPDGWSTHGIAPPKAGPGLKTFVGYTIEYTFDTEFKAFTPDLSSAVMVNESSNLLAPGAVDGFLNAYRRDNTDDSYQALTTSVPTVFEEEESTTMLLAIEGFSGDGEHSVFEAHAALTPNAASSEKAQLYAATGSGLHLASVLPNGQANPQWSWAGSGRGAYSEFPSHGEMTLSHAISDDGSRIFWSSHSFSSNPQGPLYVRENPDQEQSALNGSNECTEPAKACTVLVSADSSSYFWDASADGSKALFTTGSYRGGPATLSIFDVDAETTTPIAGQVRGVSGASDDLSRIYFVSEENLDAGATAGGRNLYVYDEGAITFIATLSNLDTGSFAGTEPPSDTQSEPLYRSTKVTPDGRHLAFMSTRSLTGYDNTDVVSGEADYEVFLYDADSEQLTCISCNPSGARPVGDAYRRPYRVNDSEHSFAGHEYRAAAWLNTAPSSLYEPHSLSDDGNRLFFNSFDALVPGDTNSQQDVYQWEAQGTGSCQKAGGCISLISTGQGKEKSEFVDASADGRDVFIETSSGIDPRDPYGIDIYDARAGGGYPPPPAPPTPCIGDACQSIPAAPNDQTPSSASFKGSGNPAPRKPRRSCRARGSKASQATRHAKQKQAKRCKRAKRRAGR